MGWAYTAPLEVRVAGEIRAEGNTTPTEIGGASTDFTQKVQVEVFDTEGPARHAGLNVINNCVDVIIPGLYHILASITFNDGGNTAIAFALFKNDGATRISSIAAMKLVTGMDLASVTVIGLAQLEKGDTLELWCQNESAATDIIVRDVSLCLQKV
jgi:hypothetical protein